MSLWERCQGEKFCKHIEIEPWRVVEAQHISSSRDLVDNIEEHDLLESLLEESKPLIAHKKHYLIFTPFRYPPLKYGSRFGRTYEPSLWYGSHDLQTAFAEVAYYRLKFFADTLANLEYSEIPMSAFKVAIKAKKGIDLTKSPFNEHQDKISNKISYEYSQPLGSDMRKAGIEAFIFFSARAKQPGKNIAAFTPDIFVMQDKQYIFNMQNWRCLANANVIEFTRDEILTQERQLFAKNEFEGLEAF
ncbi:RES domain [Legionella beliardensis]|uniref:RES domain n=1 Tax=Legionella beliardensis TaxID=91822 RepID=A0A378I1K8_9GAMM|nr:RES family NAD+ phosphorylase [Legionella beliardensis]STX28873.1 RES domain [Legionella beliardensis]